MWGCRPLPRRAPRHLSVGSAKELMVSLIVRQRVASGFFQLYRSNRSKFYFELLVFSIHADIF